MTLPPRLLVPLATLLLAALVWCGNASPGPAASELTTMEFSTLAAGATARVGYSGPVRESFPAQATAAYLVPEDSGS